MGVFYLPVWSWSQIAVSASLFTILAKLLSACIHHSVTPSELPGHKQSPAGSHDLTGFYHDFELLYCQRKVEWLHFVCPCVHLLVYAVLEVEHMGPLPCYSQWTMEQTIGDLG